MLSMSEIVKLPFAGQRWLHCSGEAEDAQQGAVPGLPQVSVTLQ